MRVVYRSVLYPEDCGNVERLVRSSGFFSEEEIETSRELVSERLRLGIKSGYHFIFADAADIVSADLLSADRASTDGTAKDGTTANLTVGYTCFGRIPATVSSFDLYWVVVGEDFRHGGLGTALLKKTEETIVRMGGRRLYAETSSKPLYEPTRAFYTRRGFYVGAILEDFYADGDAKVIFIKTLGRARHVRKPGLRAG
ncbi:MAG: GNAT family N-acetyltransferase [Spirochaetes bacterium]|nr:GNAT family N-acetyltransferase [Spirochaetota bacterium]